jgi:hypothetical protein
MFYCSLSLFWLSLALWRWLGYCVGIHREEL